MVTTRSTTLYVHVEDAARTCRIALERAGATPYVASRVVQALIRNEQRCLGSHGLLRIEEYLHEIAAEVIDVAALPSVSSPSAQVRVVDGRRSFGVLAAEAVADAICDVLVEHEIATVALRNANHIGALRDIGEAVTARGSIVLGFVNYLGAGQRVLPWNGAPPGRLCTNPVLVAVPAGSGPPFVLDISTSAVAEGKIRERWLRGCKVPEGWLVDAGWDPVTDPSRLYADPPSAFMTPLGASEGHKGFGLALAVELLAGVIAGAGFVGPHRVSGGNGGLFIGLRPTLAGRTCAEIAQDSDALRSHTSVGGARWPGERTPRNPSDPLELDTRVWRAIKVAAGSVVEGLP